MSEQQNIVIIGAGVSGLTTAALLSRDPRNRIVVVAKHMPGDYDIEYTSPWAGANYMPVSIMGTDAAKYDADTWPVLDELAKSHPESGMHYQDCEVYVRSKDSESATGKWFSELLSKEPWFKDIVPEEIPASKLPAQFSHGTTFKSVCINTAVYLPYLISTCLATGRVTFKRGIISHIVDAARYAPSPNSKTSSTKPIVINCSGLLARTLGGVEDKTVVPARGQIIVVRNEIPAMRTVSGVDALDLTPGHPGQDPSSEVAYMMMRAAGGGTILGGCYQKGNWDEKPDMALAERIMKRAIELCPELVGEGQGIEGLDVVRHGVGLRPVREDGIRIEKEFIRRDQKHGGDEGVWVVHNYGHGGYGYQSSWGCSKKVKALVEEIAGRKEKAKL